MFDFLSENCPDEDQTYTLSHSMNDLKRSKRSTDIKKEVLMSEIESFYNKVDELQTHVLSQQETLSNIVNKVSH